MDEEKCSVRKTVRTVRHRVGARRAAVCWIAFVSCLIPQCQEDDYNLTDGTDLPRINAAESGVYGETDWVVDAHAAVWSKISWFAVTVTLYDVPNSGDSGSTGDTTIDDTNGATFRVSLSVNDGPTATYDHSYSDKADYFVVHLPVCDLTPEECAYAFHLRIESLTSEVVSLDSSLDASITVGGGCLGASDSDIQGLSISLEQITE